MLTMQYIKETFVVERLRFRILIILFIIIMLFDYHHELKYLIKSTLWFFFVTYRGLR